MVAFAAVLLEANSRCAPALLRMLALPPELVLKKYMMPELSIVAFPAVASNANCIPPPGLLRIVAYPAVLLSRKPRLAFLPLVIVALPAVLFSLKTTLPSGLL